jgi:hypothetical protein
MPHRNGVELAITIRKTYPTVNILLLSLIAKPVHPTNLIERLKEFK